MINLGHSCICLTVCYICLPPHMYSTTPSPRYQLNKYLLNLKQFDSTDVVIKFDSVMCLEPRISLHQSSLCYTGHELASAIEREEQGHGVCPLDELSRSTHMFCQHDWVTDKPGRIRGASEVVNARRASVLRQNRHDAGGGKEGLGVYTDSTGFVP